MRLQTIPAGLSGIGRRAGLAAALAIIGLAAAGTWPASALDAPVAFERSDSDVCYRIPSVVRVPSGFVMMIERRFGLAGGRRVCNDDGRIDLVVSRSADGITWSDLSLVLDARALSDAMADPRSEVYDPEFAAVSADRRWVRAGSQSLAAVGDTLIAAYEVRYNLVDDCGDPREGCINSPENVDRGTARSRYFEQSSPDGGLTWSSPRRIHAEIYASCIDRLVRDPALRAALGPVFADDARIDPAAARTRRSIEAATAEGSWARNLPSVAQLLAVDEKVLRRESDTVKMILNRKLRVGPGNATVFEYAGRTRVFQPGAQLSFYSDDLGRSWTCADTTRITRGSERQVADLGEGRLVMTLRPIGGFERHGGARLFAVSTDGGETWSADGTLEDAGGPMLPDAVAQGAIVGIAGASPPQAVVSSVMGPTPFVRAARDAGARQDRPKRRRDGADAAERPRRDDRTLEEDPRVGLALTRVVFEDGAARIGETGVCGRRTRSIASRVIWPDSAAYSVMVHLPETGEILIAFEAGDDAGPATKARGWNEAIRVARVPLSDIPVAEDPANCAAPP